MKFKAETKQIKYGFSIFLVLILTISSKIWAQSQSIDSTYVYQILENDNVYSGTGLQWLKKNSDNKQFILFGEQHGVNGIPKFVSYIYKEHYNDGFNHLVLEMDSWVTNQILNTDVEQVIKKYPHAIAFDYNGDIDLIKTATEQLDNKKPSIWGVDQMVTAIHPFQRLVELANTSTQKRLARGAYLKATLKMGEYLREEHFNDLTTLTEAFKGNSNEEVSEILKSLKTSMDIYTSWRAGNRGEISMKFSTEMREEYMKSQFDSYLSAYPNAKVIFKMGGAHTINGIGPNGVLTLGDHVKKVAENNGSSTLSIGIRSFNPEPSLLSEKDFEQSNIALVDTKLFKKYAKRESKEHAQDLNGFDAIIYLKDTPKASRKIINAHKNKFESNLINSLIPIAILVLICSTSIVPMLRVFIKRSKNKFKLPILLISIFSLILVGIVVTQILWFMDYPSHKVSISSDSTSLWLYLFLFLVGILFLSISIYAYKKEWWTKSIRFYYALLAISFCGIVYYMYYWNIGGMLM